MQIIVGVVLIAAGLALVVSALPLTRRAVRIMPQWVLTRGDVERLGSTTFLLAFIGLLVAFAGAALLLTATLAD